MIKSENITSNTNNSKPIGIFDSGVGGLSIAKCIQAQLPNEHLIYMADSLYAPYGCKPTHLIQERVEIVAQHLLKKNVKALVVACNTATVNAIEQLREKFSIPIIGVEPAIKPAAIYSKTKKVGILVTHATASNQRFLSLVNRFSANTETIIQPSPGLVELIEQGEIDSQQCHTLLLSYLNPLLQNQVDTLVLGCTHYPFLINKIKAIVGTKMKIMETAAPVTEQLSRKLFAHQLSAPADQVAHYEFYSSNSSSEQTQLFSNLWQNKITLNAF
jgi:glutamate racemase